MDNNANAPAEIDTLPTRDKYRASWLRASESQRQMLCMRFGLVYTLVNDENLLQQVSHLQQQKYLQNKIDKMERQSTALVKEDALSTVGAFALLKKIRQKKVATI